MHWLRCSVLIRYLSKCVNNNRPLPVLGCVKSPWAGSVLEKLRRIIWYVKQARNGKKPIFATCWLKNSAPNQSKVLMYDNEIVEKWNPFWGGRSSQRDCVANVDKIYSSGTSFGKLFIPLGLYVSLSLQQMPYIFISGAPNLCRFIDKSYKHRNGNFVILTNFCRN